MAWTDDNIQLEFTDANGASEYQFEYNPATIESWYEEIKEPQPTANGLTKYYFQGFKAWFKLTWHEPLFFQNDMYDRLRGIKNLQTEITIVPNPVSAPGACYDTNWINDFDFTFVRGVSPIGYVGTMVLEGTCLLSEIDGNYGAVLGST